MQVPISIIPTGGGLSGTSQSIFFNVPKAVSQGFELETIWQPIDHLQVLFNYSYLDAKVKEASGVVDPADPTAAQPGATPNVTTTSIDAFTGRPVRGQDLDGNHLPNAPSNKVAINVNYTFEMSAGSLTAGATYVWRSEQYGSIFDRDYYKAPSYDQVDLRAIWKDADDKYTIIAFVKNVFDDLGYEAGTTAGRRAGFLPPFVLGRAGFAPVAVDQGSASTYTLTPPRTYGIEFQYKFF
jgi:iron complex outermembrane receptor protein